MKGLKNGRRKKMNNKSIDHVIETDVLVIGSGLAGSLATIGCHQQGMKVTVVNKGSLCWSGATVVCGGNDIAVCFPEDDKSSWMKAYVEYSEYTADQEWINIFQNESFSYLQALAKLGEKYNTTIVPLEPEKEKGGFWRVIRYINDNPTVLCDLYAAQEVFRKEIIANKIEYFERTSVSHLLTNGSKIAGAVGFNYRTGETYMFKSKAVVLAAGTCTYMADLFDVCGEGYRMAYEIGAKMMGFDRGGAIVRPRYVMRGGTLCSSTVSSLGHALGGRLVNSLGEDFIKNMPPEMKELGRVGVDLAIKKEIAEGRGPIYEDYTQLDEETVKVLRRMRKASWKRTKAEYGIDLFKERVPLAQEVEQTVTPDISNRMGGVWVDHKCAASIPGLFVVGDNTWPALAFQHPYNGAELGWALLSGSRVGPFVKEYVESTNDSNDENLIEVAKEKLKELTLPLLQTSGKTPDEIKEMIVACMVPYDEVHCDKEHLEKALAEVKRLQNDVLPHLKARDFHELREALEVQSMVLVAEMILRSELFREESRCGVRRKDFPLMDNVNWLKWIGLEKHKDGMKIFTEEIPTPYYKVPLEVKYPTVNRL
jgi:succinate dehydrogenase/fumarate reductase flavoprotein subunit